MEHCQWQSLLKRGNQCFHDQQWQQAEFFYSEAYDLLAHQFRETPTSTDILMAWICTCHNLSSLYEQKGKLELSLRFLMVPHEYLKEITDSDIGNHDIKLIAYRGLSVTLTPILEFAKKHPVCDSCTGQLESLKLLLEQDAQVIH